MDQNMTAMMGKLFDTESIIVQTPFIEIVKLLGLSTLLGTVLVIFTFYTNVSIRTSKDKTVTVNDRIRNVVSAANLLFICVGLTAAMLLLNNNIVRAFAVVAAITLVRFRVRLDNAKEFNAALLFAVLTGMSIGLKELVLSFTLV